MSLYKELSFNLGLPDMPEPSKDPALFRELMLLYNAIKSTAYHLDAYTGAIPPNTDDWSQVGSGGIKANGIFKVYIPAFETLAVGNTVGFYNDAGTSKAKKSIDGGLRCRGFISVGGYAGDIVEVTLIGKYPKFPAATLTPGNTYYQSGTAGLIGASGSQAVGFAINDQDLFFHPAL